MLLLILTILVVTTVVIYKKKQPQYDDYFSEDDPTFGCELATTGILIFICIGISFLTTSFTIDNKITLYEEQNRVIEERIATMIENYIEYENTTFISMKPSEDAVTTISMFPELNSNTLVKAQIETYYNNQQKLLQLKQERIDLKIWSWWLYFGG